MLSIISPVLNGERYLEMFIRSVIDQHCPMVEHIIVDGDSQDNSVKIIKKFSKEYSHIRWLSEKDSGQADAINKGISLARGPFISVLCLNDFYEPDTLNEVVNLLPTLAQPTFLVGNCHMLNENDGLLYINKPEAFTPLEIMMNKPFPYNPSAYFYHKDLHQKIGMYEGDLCDIGFLLRAFQVARVHYVNKCWGNFRMLPDSVTIKAMKTGTLDCRKNKIFEHHLNTYSVFRRTFIKMILALNKRPKFVYYLEKIKYYLSKISEI
ncbi:MAG: glycosyltransferase [Candidatus Omnitrophica bacterium]|nr:glycosyltransferase [Candidatus Omnitrophota bacterium]